MELQHGADSEQISEEFTTRLLSPKRIYFSIGRQARSGYEIMISPHLSIGWGRYYTISRASISTTMLEVLDQSHVEAVLVQQAYTYCN